MIYAETTIGTICHNDDNANDAGHRRIEVWVDTNGVIWADRDNPQDGHGPVAKDVDDAVRIISQIWSGPVWAFELADALNV
jgi:hypothetical protein